MDGTTPCYRETSSCGKSIVPEVITGSNYPSPTP